MSLEVVGLVVAALGVGFAGVQVWQGRKRKEANHASSLALASTAQPLREKAVETLTETMLILRPMEGMDQDAVAANFSASEAHKANLIKLRARMKIASGKSETPSAYGCLPR